MHARAIRRHPRRVASNTYRLLFASCAYTHIRCIRVISVIRIARGFLLFTAWQWHLNPKYSKQNIDTQMRSKLPLSKLFIFKKQNCSDEIRWHIVCSFLLSFSQHAAHATRASNSWLIPCVSRTCYAPCSATETLSKSHLEFTSNLHQITSFVK